MTTTANDPFNVAIAIFRNRGWTQVFTLRDSSSNPIDITNDELALVVIPSVTSGNADPILIKKTGLPSDVLVDGPNGKATFYYLDAETQNLISGGSYRWQYLRQQAGAVSSDVVVAGPLFVQDSPQFP